MNITKRKCVPPVTKNGECRIVVFDYEDQTITRCWNYKKKENLDLCMKTHCDRCRNYTKCFPEERGGKYANS
jgi:hypothetical protein